MSNVNRPLLRGGHFESQGNKKLCFFTSSLALNERLAVQNLLFEHCVIKVYYLLPVCLFVCLFVSQIKKPTISVLTFHNCSLNKQRKF